MPHHFHSFACKNCGRTTYDYEDGSLCVRCQQVVARETPADRWGLTKAEKLIEEWGRR